MAVYSYINENNLFSVNSFSEYSTESKSFSYNEFSVLYTISEDYGLLFDGIATIGDYANETISSYSNTEIGSILSPGSSTDDYGSILNTPTEFESFGLINDNNTPVSGIVGNIESATKYSIARASEIQGTVFLFQGKSNYYINSSYIGYGILSHSNGISSEKNTESYVGTGRAFGFGSKAERVVAAYNNSSVVLYESVDYFTITDGVATIGDYANDQIGHYSEVSIDSILSPGSSVEDYGSILDDPNLYTEREDYGLITGRGLRPFGLTSFHSSAIEKNTEDYVGSGSLFNFGTGKIFVLPIHYGKGVLKIRGAYSDLKNTESYVGTGRAFGFGSKAERTVVSYNLSSVVDYEGLDYGSITGGVATIGDYANTPISTYADVEIGSILSPGSSVEDYESILDDPNLYTEREDYGVITGRGLRPFGLTSFHSSLIEKNTEDYVGGGSLFNFGTGKIFVLPIHYGKGVLKIRGEYSDLKNTESYVGSGSLFGFGSKAERTTASYNLSSVVDYEGLDYGSISGGVATIGDYANEVINTYSQVEISSILSPGSSIEDYGSILDDPNLYTEREDYGLITGRGLRPFGLTSFSSSLIEKNTEDYVGSGTLFNFGDVKVFVLPKHIGRGVLKIRGAYSDLKNTESYVGTGRAFGFGSKAERTVVSYNESSIVDYEGLDYGSISGGVATIGDYANDQIGPYNEVEIGSLLSPGSSIEDYGSILDNELYGQETQDYGVITGRGLRPFGLTSFHSSLIEKNTEDYVGGGILFNFGTIDISSTPSYIGRGILKIRGEYSDLKNTESYVGSGSLFGFGSKAERTTASYNLSSVVDYEGLDYGSITGGVATIGDYANETIGNYSNLEIGSILSPESSTEDYGSILDNELYGQETQDYGLITGRGLRPFGLTRFSSAVIEKNTEDYVGSGSLFVFVSKSETNTYVPTSIGLFKFGGSVIQKNTESYVGTGRAFGFGSKAERTTASYNESSVVDYEGLDYGSITGGVATIGDYANITIGTYAQAQIGSILSPESSTEDYGSILDNELYGQETQDYGLITGRGLRPFGLTRFSGGYSNLKNTESYVGSGSLFGFSSTTEAFGPKPPVSGLFRISGVAAESTTPATEIGSGSLFTFISSSSILLKANIGTGLFRFSGNLVERNTESYVGSGSLFGFSSTTEAFGPKPPVSGLFRISGAATQSITPTTEIGSGTVTVRQASQILDADDKTRLIAAFESTGITEVGKPQAIRLSGKVGLYFQFRETGSGTLKVRGRAVIRLKPIHIGSGSYFIRGSAAESTTPATEIGSGSLFTFVSKVESFGANPPENTALFKFRGSSINRNAESYVGIGLERINVESLILIRPRYPGSGSISVTSTFTDSRSYNHIGTGKLFGFGSASEYLTNAYKLDTFVIRIRGSAREIHTERFVGSGSIFAFISAAESKGSNPPENTVLFKFGGSSSARTQPIYVGEGKVKISEGSGRPDQNNKTYIISSDESSSIRTREKPVQIKVFGSGSAARPAVYKGKGSLFGFSSSSESAAFSPDNTRELFKISGSAVEKNTESYTGSGSVFSFVGTSYSFSKNTRGETNLFSINGSANESFGEGLYTGSGRLVTDLRSSSTVSFTPKITTTLFNFIGSSRERNTEAFSGSGSIGVFTSTAKSVFYDYKVSQKAFRIFGNTFESFARSNYYGVANTNIEGASEDRKINYIPPKRVRIFVV